MLDLPKMLCHVTVRSGPAHGAGCVVSNDYPMIFGRQESNDCVLANDSAISRQHFHVFIKDETCWVADLNSRNGTYLNNHPIVSSQLSSGDEIKAGNTRLRVEIKDQDPDPAFDQASRDPESSDDVDQELIETMFAGAQREFESVPLSQAYVQSDRFLDLLIDLPGLAIVINHSESAKTVETFGREAIEIQKNAYLVFPSCVEQVGQILAEYGESDSVLILDSHARRSALLKRLQNSFKSFKSAPSFWDEISQVPREIASRHLAGIDFVIGRSPSERNAFRAFVCTTADPTVVRELERSSRSRG